MEVANGLLGTGCPQAILPGGTGNAMALALDIPATLKEAAQLLVGGSRRCAVDVVRSSEKAFMLRAYSGLSFDGAASREDKDRLGQLAYVQASLKLIRQATPVYFRATIDGEVTQVVAYVCFLLNAGTIGNVLGINIPPVGNVSVEDGYLDFFAITPGVQPLRAITNYLFKQDGSDNGIYHWRAREITLEAEPAQEVWLDGEPGGTTPFTARVLPQALEIVVPD